MNNKVTPEQAEKILSDSCAEYCKAVEALAISEAGYKEVDAMTKTVLAREFHKVKVGGMKNKEMFALWSEKYITHISVLGTARKQFLHDKAKRDLEMNRWETARSLLSFQKATAIL